MKTPSTLCLSMKATNLLRFVCVAPSLSPFLCCSTVSLFLAISTCVCSTQHLFVPLWPELKVHMCHFDLYGHLITCQSAVSRSVQDINRNCERRIQIN